MPNEELLLSFARFQQPSVRCLKPTRISWRNTERRSHCAGSTMSSWWSLKVCREIKRVTAADEICAINRGVLFLGNIRVLCRVKPVLKEDQHEEGQSVVVTTDSNNESSLSVLNKGKGRIFELDKVFHPQASQEEVWKWTACAGNTVKTRTLNPSFGFIRSFRRLSLWWRRASMATMSAYLRTDRLALEKRTPWR